jgi:hypothetical protein
MPNIQGVRVTVSGRVGGRSKKSNRARSETWKYGATPLHVFSREIDYAQRVARTPLGTSGCFRLACSAFIDKIYIKMLQPKRTRYRNIINLHQKVQ